MRGPEWNEEPLIIDVTREACFIYVVWNGISMTDNNVEKTEIQTDIKDKLKDSLWVALFASFSLGIFAPMEFFASNAASFWFDFEDMMLVSGIAFAIIFVTIFVVCFGISYLHSKTGQAVIMILAALTVMLYVQGNFGQADYGYLGAETIDFSAFKEYGYSNASLWLGMLTLFALLFAKKKYLGFVKVMKVLTICILLVQVITLIAVAPLALKYEHKENYVATTEGINNYSDQKNMVIIIPDTFDSRVMYDLLQGEEGDECRAILKDFTYYRDTLSCYSLTDFSVPQILTGEKYLNQCEYGDYLNDAFGRSSLLDRLYREGWDMTIGTTITLPQDGIADKITNWNKVDYMIDNTRLFIRDYYRTLGFRYLPHVLKEYVYFDVDELEDYRAIKSINGEEPKGVTQYDWTNLAFRDSIGEMVADSDRPTFHVLHTKGLHSHRNVDLDFKELGEKDDLPLDYTAKVVLKSLDEYIAKLKEMGIYDNTIIVIAADHGSSSYASGDLFQNTVLLIKGIGESHDFIELESQISYDDLQSGYQNLLDGKVCKEVFDIDEDVSRERHTYKNGYKGALVSFSKAEEFDEYVVNGPSYLYESAKKTGKKY